MGQKERNEGEAIRREVMGTAHVDRSLGNATDFDMPLQEATMEQAWGGVWTRDGLDRKTRAMICVISDTCLHCWPELELHVRFARRMGWTEDEITEALLHVGGYIGVPTIREAMIIAGKVFKEMNEEDDTSS